MKGTEGELVPVTEDPLKMENRWEDPSPRHEIRFVGRTQSNAYPNARAKARETCACVTEPRHGEQQACPRQE